MTTFWTLTLVISMAGLFFLAEGTAPPTVRRRFLVALGVQVVVGVAAALVRPDTELGESVHIGNFVELKKAVLGKGTKAGDLASICFHVLEPEKTSTIQGIEVFPFRVPHQVNEISLALKVSYNGKHVLFSGDSAWTDEFLEHARGVDVFICECTYYDRETSNHMSYLELREQLPRLSCRRIILTHMGSDMLTHSADVYYEMAEDGMVVEI